MGVPVEVVVDVCDDEAVAVCDCELVAVPVAVSVRDGEAVKLPVPVPELLGVAVCDGEGVRVCDGVCVGVMVGARKHGRTLSTRSIDDSLSSTALATRMVRSCAPADGRLTLKRCQPLRW